jgi:hypothetical protein
MSLTLSPLPPHLNQILYKPRPRIVMPQRTHPPQPRTHTRAPIQPRKKQPRRAIHPSYQYNDLPIPGAQPAQLVQHLHDEKREEQALPRGQISKRCNDRRQTPTRPRLLRNIIRRPTTHIPRPDIRQFAVLREHRRIRTNIRYRRAECAKVRVMRDISIP